MLVHLVDLNAEDPIQDYVTIQQELIAYGRGLPELPQIIALNKLDTGDQEFADFIKEELQEITDYEIMTISAVSRAGLDQLLQRIWDILDELNAADEAAKQLEIEAARRAEAELLLTVTPPHLEESVE